MLTRNSMLVAAAACVIGAALREDSQPDPLGGRDKRRYFVNSAKAPFQSSGGGFSL